MFCEAGDPRCSLAGRRRLIFCQCLLAPLYAARQYYKDRRCGSRRSCLWLELWVRRLSLREPKGGALGLLLGGAPVEADSDRRFTHSGRANGLTLLRRN